jgi:hypothetical protein
MMLRSLVDEVVRRRLWPIPLVALLVAIAAPLMFMKAAPTNAPTGAPPLATPTSEPASVRGLLDSSDKPRGTKRSKRKAQDPFAPPASSTAAASASAGTASSGATSSAQSVPVVIKNADGSTSTATIAPSTGTTKSTGSTKTTKTTKAKSTAPKTTTTPKITVPKVTTSSAAATSKVTYVDVRFGERMGTMTRFRVPRLQTFRAGGKVAAMFVGYSAVRNAAVFAVAPSTRITGVTCREVKHVCRYVDLPAGAHARLTLRGENGSAVSRRLDVVRIRHLLKVTGSKASARMTTMTAAKCLLKGLLALPVTAPSISTDSCA